jgi:3-hydroxyisobutyrate dehydrogenase
MAGSGPVRSVAVLGTGIMGAPMARNLAAAGLDVTAWNRTPEKARPLAEHGIMVAGSPSDAAADADAVLTMLTAGEAVEEVMTGGALETMAPDALWIQSSTVGLGAISRLASLAGERRVAFADAPVLGTKQPAESGELIVVAGGPEDVLDRCGPVFEAVGARTIRAGGAGAGTRLKLVVNGWLLALTASLAEVLALSEAIGLEPSAFLETIAGGPLDVGYAHLKGKLMLERSFPPSFPLRLADKDAALVVEAAEQAALPLEVQRAVRGAYARAAAEGHGDEDMAAVYHSAAG